MIRALIIIADSATLRENDAINNWWMKALPFATIEELQDATNFAGQIKMERYLYFHQDFLKIVDFAVKKYNISCEYILEKARYRASDMDKIMDNCKYELPNLKFENVIFLAPNILAYVNESSSGFTIIGPRKSVAYQSVHQLQRIILDDHDDDD